MTKAKEKLTTDKVILSLPEAPEGYSYEVEQESQMWWRIWLVNHFPFSHTAEKVRTVYGYVKKNGGCHPPLDTKKPRQREVLCQLVDLKHQSPYSMIVPKVTSLLHLL